MTRHRSAPPLSLPLTLICLGSAPAFACTASDQLTGFGQSYAALLQADSQASWQSESARLSQTLTTTDTASLGRDLNTEGAPADITRIARLFADASSLLNSSWSNRASHTERARQNLAYIDRMVTASGCKPIEPTLSQTGETTDAFNPQSTATPTQPAINTPLLVILTLLALAAALGAAAFVTLSKRGPSKRLTERLTRYPAVLPVLVTTEGRDPALIDTADISQGGVRLSWTDAPAEGTAITIDFSEVECPARIIWSNAYFAGARFDTLLSTEDLTRIRNRNNTI